MRKISPDYENPIDNYVLDFVDDTEKYFRKLDFTPNELTTISLITGCLSAYFFYKGSKIFAVLLLIVSYYFDCMDGHYARKYNLETEFGDYYDHFSDLIKFLLIGYVMYVLNKDRFYEIMPFLIIFAFLVFVHLGCQEHLYNSKIEQPFMSKLKNLCEKSSWINTTKYFGCGTQFVLLLVIMLWY